MPSLCTHCGARDPVDGDSRAVEDQPPSVVTCLAKKSSGAVSSMQARSLEFSIYLPPPRPPQQTPDFCQRSVSSETRYPVHPRKLKKTAFPASFTLPCLVQVGV